VASENREVRIPARIEDRLKLLEAPLVLLGRRVDRLTADQASKVPQTLKKGD
jgi:hypothetical protein